MEPAAPILYEINTRVWLSSLPTSTGQAIPLDAVPDRTLDDLARLGIDWIWLLGVWTVGPAARNLARGCARLQSESRRLLPDPREADIGGSCFAIQDYTVSDELGGGRALARFRARLHRRGLRLMLDFVPNHTGIDHPWAREHPEYYLQGTPEDWNARAHEFTRLETRRGPVVFAHGRDPWFPGWRDTLQLDYAEPALVRAMTAQLRRVASACDGVRCDMAMLILPEVFERTWGRRALSFWPEAIRRVKQVHPDFPFLAEVYWDLEPALQQLGFDYTYDKVLYDELRDRSPAGVQKRLRSDPRIQRRMARFLENHDEARAAASFPPDAHPAAAVIAYLAPGLKLFHQGQLEGARGRLPVQLIRGPRETPDPALAEFYRGLLRVLRLPVIRHGRWQRFECRPAWEGNWTWDCIVAFGWERPGSRPLLIAVNYSDHHSQACVPIPGLDQQGRSLNFTDLWIAPGQPRRAVESAERGLLLDLPPWGYRVLEEAEPGPRPAVA